MRIPPTTAKENVAVRSRLPPAWSATLVRDLIVWRVCDRAAAIPCGLVRDLIVWRVCEAAAAIRCAPRTFGFANCAALPGCCRAQAL